MDIQSQSRGGAFHSAAPFSRPDGFPFTQRSIKNCKHGPKPYNQIDHRAYDIERRQRIGAYKPCYKDCVNNRIQPHEQHHYAPNLSFTACLAISSISSTVFVPPDAAKAYGSFSATLVPVSIAQSW